ncbi:MAG TPA: hypothetical protein VK387_00235, partial [Thermoleophilaceae bacterium]|nr:hypothetical protein [Thermoleophilaceae bacterium]
MIELVAASPPPIDFKGFSPLLAAVAGSVVVLMAGLARAATVQRVVLPSIAVLTLIVTAGLAVWNWSPGPAKPIVAGALTIDTLTLFLTLLFCLAGVATIL